MPKILSLIDQKFGRLTVVERVGSTTNKSGRKAIAWRCMCDCGNQATAVSNDLRGGNTRSCGCLMIDTSRRIGTGHKHGTRLTNLTGRRFNHVTALRATNKRRSTGAVVWICQCDCGTIIEAASQHLVAGGIGSCGCQKGKASISHGATRNKQWTTEYIIWAGMISRCYSPRQPAYPRYGGRGISVCDRWRDFANFLSDMGPRPAGKTLDRWPNNHGNYEPSNCRWATDKEQARNKRNNRLITLNHETLCLVEWAELSGISANHIARRLQQGWNTERAIWTPVKARPPMPLVQNNSKQ